LAAENDHGGWDFCLARSATGSGHEESSVLEMIICSPVSYRLLCKMQGSHAFLESPGFFFFKIPGPEKSGKITLVLESTGKIVAT